MNKKLIEVAIPLEVINDESSREKSIRTGHPSTLHLWWARRPLSTARAVIFASLVDDPSSHPELFKTVEDQNRERERLFRILGNLIKWENSNNATVINEAKNEIEKYVPGPITFLDPFAGGGALPLEAKRLGLISNAYDLNPVSVLINKAMVEMPSIFKNRRPVNPEARTNTFVDTYDYIQSLSEDVRYYGNLLRKITLEDLKQFYPDYTTPEGNNNTIIAWLWSRSVVCPNPLCRCIVPIVRSTTLSIKHKKYIKMETSQDKVEFEITNEQPEIENTITSKRVGVCPKCHTPFSLDYLYDQYRNNKVKPVLMTVVCEGNPGRLYYKPTKEQIDASVTNRPSDVPQIQIEGSDRNVSVRHYGMNNFSDLYSDRQLLTIVTLCNNLNKIKTIVQNDCLKAGLEEGKSLHDGGNGAIAYSEAIITYLAFVVDKIADYNSTLCSWHSSGEKMSHTFARQAIPMVWDYAECNIFSNSTGSFYNMLDWVVKSIEQLPKGDIGIAKQHNAMEPLGIDNAMISTDPPYYDNIDYADLSDYFYMWLRMCLKNVHPDIFTTIKVPKEDELVALPHRHNNDKKKAKEFFEEGMIKALSEIYRSSRSDIPVTIYYAFKQREAEIKDKTTKYSSSGWETFLNALIQAGFTITGTWPMRTEMSSRIISLDTNALSSSIVLVCRKQERLGDITQREFISKLKQELIDSLEELQNSNIAPVDLAQSIIGPGISVYSRYDNIIMSDGSKMDVKTALQIINRELDAYLNENEATLDAESRFCIELYTNYAYNEINYGDADVLARAKNTSIERMKTMGILKSERGKVCLVDRQTILENDINKEKKPTTVWHMCQHLTGLLENEGIDACARFLIPIVGPISSEAKSLAYHLYTIAEKKKWKQEAIAYNSLITSWPDIQVKKDELVELFSPKEKITLERWSV